MSKIPTHLVNVYRHPNTAHKLGHIYKCTLNLLKKLPEESAYRTHTEAIICHRMCVLQQAEGDAKKIEEEMSCGSLEMLIRQAQDEYSLLQNVLLWGIWEPLKENPPPGQWTWPPC